MKILYLLFFLFLTSAVSFAYDKDSGCVKCHADKEMLTKLGYPQMYLDPEKVDKEVNMGGITCVDCHMGNNKALDKDEAHKGMPRPFYAAIGKNYKYEAVGREVTGYAPIMAKGNKRIEYLMTEPAEDVKQKYGIKTLAQLFYHDHDNVTMAYSPKIASATCGKCHEKEMNDYNKSGMGLNKAQRAFTNWHKNPPGPQNCGVWWEDNYEKIKNESAKEFTPAMSKGLDRGCNKCHASCLDCHYNGHTKSEARHTFQKEPDKLTCYGSGKGEICHSGPMDRRRGAGYIREEYAFPQGKLPADVHSKNGIECSVCHKMKDHSYGHLGSSEARQSCKDCHMDIYNAVKTGEHSNVDCSSCHINEVGAYQFTFWGPGISEGQYNIFTKHKEYYGIRTNTTLIKHPATKLWIPVKPYPMGVMNMRNDAQKTGILLREIQKTMIKGKTEIGQPEYFSVERKPDEVNDMYAITGTFNGFEGNDKMLAWIQMDKMSHGIGKGKNCESCHSSHEQKAVSTFTYNVSNNVKKPFNGSYTITAGKNGITFSDLKFSEIEPVEGRKTTDFAPFVKGFEFWNLKGVDLSIPFSEKKYKKEKEAVDKITSKINTLKQKYSNDQSKLKELNNIQILLYHNRKVAENNLNKFSASNK